MVVKFTIKPYDEGCAERMDFSLSDVVYSAPTWMMGVCIILIFLVSGLLGLYLSRDWVRERFRFQNQSNDAVNGFFAGIGVLYGLLIGLVAVANWNNFDDVEDLVSKEASSIGSFYNDVEALQEPTRSRLVVHISDYLTLIIEREWPAHSMGHIAPAFPAELAQIHDTLIGYQPTSTNQQEFLAHCLDVYDRMIDLRQQRIAAVTDDRVPEVFWYVIIFGSMLSIVVTYCFHLPSFSSHALLTGLYCSFLGLMIFLIAAVDNPFRGGVSIKPMDYINLRTSVELR